MIKVPAKQSEVITVDQNNVVSAIIDRLLGCQEFTGLDHLGAEKPAEEKPALTVQVSWFVRSRTRSIDDKSFNATAWKGIEDAQKDFGIDAKFLESQEASDYEKTSTPSSKKVVI